MSVWAIVVAAGSGSRFGGAKQYAALAGRRVLDWSVDAARAQVDSVVLVVGDNDVATIETAADIVVAGGATRSASVRAGLAAVPHDASIVVVHDAARPLASPALFASVIDTVRAGAPAGVAAVAVTDTIRHREGGIVNREELVAVQTPQAFDAVALRRAHATNPEATDDGSLVELDGGRVTLVEGEPTNLKITEATDLAVAEAYLAERTAREMTRPDPMAGERFAIRVGHGFDMHRFSSDPQRPLVLGGLRFPGAAGLEGHSDADAVTHAVIDALLAAAGLGDIGQLFPDTEPALAGADSIELLREAVRLVRAGGWSPGNVDCTVVAEAPKLAPRRAEMQQLLSDVVGAPVTVKGKRAEGLGTLGRREGIACFAVAIVFQTPNQTAPASGLQHPGAT